MEIKDFTIFIRDHKSIAISKDDNETLTLQAQICDQERERVAEKEGDRLKRRDQSI